MSDETADEFLDWLCWTWAKDGERFYPHDDTAYACIEAVMENYEEWYDNPRTLTLKLLEAYQWELGQHSRALMQARENFRTMERHNLNPIERAAREQRDLMERADNDLEPIDWSWYND